MKNIDFATWLQTEMDKRRWNISDLAEASGVNQPTLSRILSMDRNAGPDVATKIAAGLELPPDIVFRHAGILPPIPSNADDPTNFKFKMAWIYDIAKGLTADELQELVDYALFIFRKKPRPVPEPVEPSATPEDLLERAGIERMALRRLMVLVNSLLKEPMEFPEPSEADRATT